MADSHCISARGRPPLEVSHIFDRYLDDFRGKYRLHTSHLKVIHCIKACRSAALGGHIDQCDTCCFEGISYNSCSNRHCPKCRFLATERWLEAREADLLPVGYFHSVFTLPHALNPIILVNKKVCLDLLFKAVQQTLTSFAANPRWGFPGQLGWIGILHTWDQKLLDHFHLHCLIPAGTLSFDKKQWNHPKKNFLFPVKALAKVFRSKFLILLKQAYHDNKLIFPGQTKCFQTQSHFQALIDNLFDKPWVVYAKRPFAGPKAVLSYLGRYTHRIAISNYRIVSIDNNKVTFTYRDRADHNKKKLLTLEATEFIRRFLLHVLPKGYCKIRSFGFLANRDKKTNVKLCRELIGQPLWPPTPHEDDPSPAETIKKTYHELILARTGFDVTVCPRCKKGKMLFKRVLAKGEYYDSS